MADGQGMTLEEEHPPDDVVRDGVAAEFAEKFDVPYAIPLNSATTGLSVALAAAGVGPGDEVIVPAISFPAL